MKNPLITFLAGLALSVGGLYLLFQMVHVNLGFGGMFLGNHYVSSGIVMIPFIIAIVWIFVNPKSIFAKILLGAGVLMILACIISNIHFSMIGVSLFEFIMVLIMIFGGFGLLIRVLFSGDGK